MLDLRFSTFAGRAILSCDPGSVDSLQALRSQYASGVSISEQAFELEIDDLLVNLRELALWPAEDSDIRWQPELRTLVEGNAADTAVLQARIDETAPHQQQVVTQWSGWAPDAFTDFQRRDITKLLQLTHGANFSVPGAGKTRVTLAIFMARREAREVSRMLVVCPKAAFESWQLEIDTCLVTQQLRVAIMDTALPPVADVVLVNYERLPDSRPALAQWLRAQPALLVLDEAHRMKLGPSGAWGAACLALGPYAARRIILTGTPAPNGPKDLENLFSFVWPGQGRTAVSRALSGRDLRSASELLRPLFVRTTKNELQLTPPEIAVRRLNLPPIHRNLYNALLGQFSGPWHGGEDIEALGKVLLYLIMAATTPALLATGSSRHEPLAYRIPPLLPREGSSLVDLMRDLPQFELSPKYQEVAAIVARNASEGRKTLVWSTFVRNLTSLEQLLSDFRPAIIHGGTENRSEQLKRFREHPSCLVLLSNPATLGEGVSLHHVCHDAVYIDRDFAAGRFIQSLDRIHRLGLKPGTRTRITILVANETVDELVEQRLAAKLQFMGSVLDDPAVLQLGDLDEEPSVSAGMDSSDIGALLDYLRRNAST